MASCFGNLSIYEIEEIEGKLDKESTKRVIQKLAIIFRSFLREKGRDESFESLSTEELDDESLFMSNARTEKVEFYKLSSFNQIKYGLSKYLWQEKSWRCYWWHLESSVSLNLDFLFSEVVITKIFHMIKQLFFCYHAIFEIIHPRKKLFPSAGASGNNFFSGE